jgi:hypothetical protein
MERGETAGQKPGGSAEALTPQTYDSAIPSRDRKGALDRLLAANTFRSRGGMKGQERPVFDLLQPSAIEAIGCAVAPAVGQQVLQLIEHYVR